MKSLFALFLILVPTVSFAEEYLCVARKVYDGDSITKCEMDDGEIKNVRLAGINAPERGQEHGIRSREDLANKIEGYVVTVQKLGIDRWGRDIGVVYFKGENMNEYQLQKGNAWYYKQYGKGFENYELLEFIARNKKLGLWGYNTDGKFPTPPWEFRGSK